MKKYPLSDTETDAAAEYMAGILLKNNKDYSLDLVSYEDSSKTETVQTKAAETGITGKENAETSENKLEKSVNAELSGDIESESGKGDNGKNIIEDKNDKTYDVTNDSSDKSSASSNNDGSGENNEGNIGYDLSEIMEKQGFDIRYTGYRFAKTLPEGEISRVFSVDSKEGYKFLVIDFSVKNITDSNRTFDMSKSNVVYRLDAAGDSYKPQTVLLENNLIFINMDIKAGEEISAILVFEIPENMDIAETDLSFYNEEKTATIKLR